MIEQPPSTNRRMLVITSIGLLTLFFIGLIFLGGAITSCENGGGILQKPFKCVDPIVVGACEFNDRVYIQSEYESVNYSFVGGFNG